ncbi:uncharacterized protein IL334_000718 [Kwoniella shivajii]|uniref:Uncharacterized protein n=1 Tax=Kwoniella shivajii TaxID=564305 RepID=A0ABZ1CQD8_9TREE|nr:hypothetical protein IL334_000718 [Kwoniella shivajii]
MTKQQDDVRVLHYDNDGSGSILTKSASTTAGSEMGDKDIKVKKRFHNKYCILSFLKPPSAIRDSPDDTPSQRRWKIGKRLAYWGAMSAGGSS